jgi:hypothetical protein
MLTEATGPLARVNVPGLSLAGFQVTLIGRFWVTPEVLLSEKQIPRFVGNVGS